MVGEREREKESRKQPEGPRERARKEVEGDRLLLAQRQVLSRIGGE